MFGYVIVWIMTKEKREDILIILLFPFLPLIFLIGIVYSTIRKLEEILREED